MRIQENDILYHIFYGAQWVTSISNDRLFLNNEPQFYTKNDIGKTLLLSNKKRISALNLDIIKDYYKGDNDNFTILLLIEAF